LIFAVSCKTGSGLTGWFTWLEDALRKKKKQ
jgi:hypothetical protein